MCGRVVQKMPLHDISVLFETVNPIPNTAPSYNGAPTQSLPIVRLDEDDQRSLDLLRWGLIPFWAKDKAIGARCINAMAETVDDETGVPECVPAAPLLGAGGLLLRMAEGADR